MCFSASASFGAGAVLSVIGIAALRKAQGPSQTFFAGIPFIFAIQQITEGCLWLSFTHTAYASLQVPATYLFLFFAQVVWPFWVPYSIYRLEKRQPYRRILQAVTGIGALVSLYLAFCLWSFPVQASVIGQHISYGQHYPIGLSRYGGMLYIIATITPPLLSGFKRMWMLGAAILISYIMTTILYEDYVISVWCFFASVISIAVLAILPGSKWEEQTIHVP